MCGEKGASFFNLPRKHREFHVCSYCTLVYQEKSTLPTREEERDRYEKHNNDPKDEGYRNWLQSFVVSSVLPWYRSGSVLDFGSGPRPVLSEMLSQQGYPVVPYDPYFAASWPLEKEFTLILLCEVLEHINDPVPVFRKLRSLAADDGILSLKTQFLPGPEESQFKGWWYKDDPTHIRFYNPSSLKVLGEKSGWELISGDDKSLGVFQKKRLPEGSRR